MTELEKALLYAADFCLVYLDAEVMAERRNAAEGCDEAADRVEHLSDRAEEFRAIIARARAIA